MDHLMNSWLGWVAMVGATWVAVNTMLGLIERPVVRDRLTGAQRGRELAKLGQYKRGLANVELALFEGTYKGRPVMLLRKETRAFGGCRTTYVRLEADAVEALRVALDAAKASPAG